MKSKYDRAKIQPAEESCSRFGFVVHPLDMQDVVRYEPKAANKREALVEKILEWMPAYKVAHITGIRSITGAEAEGWFLGCTFTPNQFITFPKEKIYKKIIAAGKIGESLGAKIIGLGGFTSVVGDAGITVAKHLDIAVTSGNSYTIATALEGAVAAACTMDIDLQYARAVVVGATGSIGSACAKILSKKVAGLTIVARHLPRLRRVAEGIKEFSGLSVEIETDLEKALRMADIVISASSSGGGIIRPGYLKPGVVVCDVALPHDVSREVADKRDDVLVIEGGLVEVPGSVNFNFDFGYPPRVALACMSETMILALEKRYENFSLGRRIEVERIEEITRLARRHGFKLAGFRSFDCQVTEDQIAAIKSQAIKRTKGIRFSTG